MELNKSIDLQTINQDWHWWYYIPDFYFKKKLSWHWLNVSKTNYSKLQVNNPLSTSITRQLSALLSFVLYICMTCILTSSLFYQKPEQTVYIWLRYVNFSWHCSAGRQTVVWCKWLGRQGYWCAASYFALRSWLNQVNAWNC